MGTPIWDGTGTFWVSLTCYGRVSLASCRPPGGPARGHRPQRDVRGALSSSGALVALPFSAGVTDPGSPLWL